jgi:hypothetical protein
MKRQKNDNTPVQYMRQTYCQQSTSCIDSIYNDNLVDVGPSEIVRIFKCIINNQQTPTTQRDHIQTLQLSLLSGLYKLQSENNSTNIDALQWYPQACNHLMDMISMFYDYMRNIDMLLRNVDNLKITDTLTNNIMQRMFKRTSHNCFQTNVNKQNFKQKTMFVKNLIILFYILEFVDMYSKYGNKTKDTLFDLIVQQNNVRKDNTVPFNINTIVLGCNCNCRVLFTYILIQLYMESKQSTTELSFLKTVRIINAYGNSSNEAGHTFLSILLDDPITSEEHHSRIGNRILIECTDLWSSICPTTTQKKESKLIAYVYAINKNKTTQRKELYDKLLCMFERLCTGHNILTGIHTDVKYIVPKNKAYFNVIHAFLTSIEDSKEYEEMCELCLYQLKDVLHSDMFRMHRLRVEKNTTQQFILIVQHLKQHPTNTFLTLYYHKLLRILKHTDHKILQSHLLSNNIDTFTSNPAWNEIVSLAKDIVMIQN